MADDRLDDPWAAFTAASTSQLEPSLTRPSLSRRSSSANLAASDFDATSAAERKGTESRGFAKTAAHPLRHEAGGNYGEATRPSLRRLVVDGSGRQESSVWIGGGDGRRSLDGWAGKGKGRAVEAGEDQRKREVLIHPVAKTETLAGVSLSYGISLAALRTANGMWPSDRLSLRPVLRIPLSLCNLPPAKRIEIESDNRAVVWEGAASPTSATSQPRSGSWGLVAAARANGTALSEALATSRVSLEMSASGSSGAPSARTSFDLLASSSSDSGDGRGRGTIRNVPALSPTDPVAAYLSTTNHVYGIESSDPVGEEDDEIPDLPTTARPRRASSSASSSVPPTTKRTLQIQTVPENELGFFSAPDTARPPRSRRTSSNEVSSPSTAFFRSLEADDALVAGAGSSTASIPSARATDDDAFSPYSVAAGIRAARLRQRSAVGSTGRHSPAVEPSTPPLSRRSSFRTMSPGPPPALSATPLRTGSPATIGPQSPVGEPFRDRPLGSPGEEKKKHVWPVAPPSRKGSARSETGGQGPKRPGLAGGLGLAGHSWSFGSGSGNSEGGGSNSSGGGTGAWLNGKRHPSSSSTVAAAAAKSRPTSMVSSGGGGKWNTVRPGQPPPLQAGLRFLEDGPTALADMLEAALSRPTPSTASPAPVPTSNGRFGQQAGSGDKLELDQLGRRPSATAASGLSVPVGGQRGGGVRKTSSRWLWDDLEQEARDAGFGP